MRKVLTILVLAAMIMSLTACNVTTNAPVDDSSGNSEEIVSSQTPTYDDSDDTQEEPASTEPPKEQVAIATEVTIEETVLVDEAGVKITAKSINDGFLGAEVKLLIENNSGKNLTFQCRNASVNGFMLDAVMSVDVVDGKKANDTLVFMSSELEACEINTIADMEWSFHVFDSDTWNTYLDTSMVQIRTSAADTYVYTYDDSGEVVYEDGGIKIVVKGLDEYNSIFGPSIIVYIENNSNNNITVQVQDVSINGFMVYGIFSSDLVSQKRAVDSITFMSSELEENGIEKIEDVELIFHIFNSDSWSAIADTDVITLSF